MRQDSKYYPEVDALRAVAVIAVIVNHLDSDILPSGFSGVDIFFVISGFVITKTIIERGRKKTSDLIKDFYARRVKRIMPLLIVYIITMGLITITSGVNSNVGTITGLTALFGVSNIYLMITSANYFNSDVELNPFTQTWSLGVEEQFYFIYPLIIVLFYRWNKQDKMRLSNVLIVLSAISILYTLINGKKIVHITQSCRFWEMAAGCIVFEEKEEQATENGNHIYYSRC